MFLGKVFESAVEQLDESEQPEHCGTLTIDGTVAWVGSKIRQAWSMRRRPRRVPASSSSFAGFGSHQM